MFKAIKNFLYRSNKVILNDDNQFELDGETYVPFGIPYTKERSSYIKWKYSKESFDEFEVEAEPVYQVFVSIDTPAKERKVITVERILNPEVKKVLSLVARLEMTVQDLEHDITALKQSNSDGFYDSQINMIKNTINHLNSSIEYYTLYELSIHNDNNFEKVITL